MSWCLDTPIECGRCSGTGRTAALIRTSAHREQQSAGREGLADADHFRVPSIIAERCFIFVLL
jgi:hypothetical protein